ARRSVQFDAERRRLQQPFDGLAHRHVVVDDSDYGGFLVHASASALLGRVNWNSAPCGSAGEAHSRPPCASVMERQIVSPIPIPLALVVKNGLKILSAVSWSSPTPLSFTNTRPSPLDSSREPTTSVFGRPVTSDMASAPLMTRLRSTC